MILSVAITVAWLIGLTWYLCGWAVAAVPLVACLGAVSVTLYGFWQTAEMEVANAVYQGRLELAAERARPGWKFPGDAVRAQDGLAEIGSGMFGVERDTYDWQQAARSRQPRSEWAQAPRVPENGE